LVEETVGAVVGLVVGVKTVAVVSVVGVETVVADPGTVEVVEVVVGRYPHSLCWISWMTCAKDFQN